MILATILALIAANSALAEDYAAWIAYPLGVSFGDLHLTHTVSHWVKEALMVLFFFTVGMELKRELVEGVLADKRQILLPLGAALGGMLVPALIFLGLTYQVPALAIGWAIPTATDIAFALAVLIIALPRVPVGVKIFLLAIAIFDDLGAILIIALWYSHGLALLPLLAAAGCVVVLAIFNRLRVTTLPLYLLLGALLCIALAEGGIHATIGGVITGLWLPLRAGGHSPLNRMLHALHPWVSFFVLPLFAFTASGVNLQGIPSEALTAPLVLGIAAGLFIGKPLGIFGISAVLIRLGYATMPEGATWRQLQGVSVLAGIGFTMSLFVGSLAFTDALQAVEVKLGVLAGSLLAALCGYALLRGAKSKAS